MQRSSNLRGDIEAGSLRCIAGNAPKNGYPYREALDWALFWISSLLYFPGRLFSDQVESDRSSWMFERSPLYCLLHPAAERERSRIRGHLWFFSPLFSHSLFVHSSSFFSSSLSIPLWVCCSHLLYFHLRKRSRSFLIFLFSFSFFGGKSIL